MEIYSPKKKSKELFKLNKFKNEDIGTTNYTKDIEYMKIKFQKASLNKNNDTTKKERIKKKRNSLGTYFFNLLKSFFEYEEVL